MIRFVLLLSILGATNVAAQEVFRCTAPDGKVTYQQSPCAKADAAKKVDVTPANTIESSPEERERLLKAGDEAGKRLEARAAAEEAERQRRAEQKRRDEERERETQAREDARDQYIYAWPGWGPPPRTPYPIGPPRPTPRPSPPPR